MVAPLRHEAALGDLTDDGARPRSWPLAQDADVAVEAAYAPDGINVGVNLGRAAGAGRARPPPRARPAALERATPTS